MSAGWNLWLKKIGDAETDLRTMRSSFDDLARAVAAADWFARSVRALSRRCGLDADSTLDEVRQEVLSRVWEGAATRYEGNSDAKAKAFLLSIGRNIVIDLLRDRVQERAAQQAAPALVQAWSEPDILYVEELQRRLDDLVECAVALGQSAGEGGRANLADILWTYLRAEIQGRSLADDADADDIAADRRKAQNAVADRRRKARQRLLSAWVTLRERTAPQSADAIIDRLLGWKPPHLAK